MSAINFYKIEKIIPGKSARRDVHLSIITFMESRKYHACSSTSFAKIRKGNPFWRPFKKNPIREIRVNFEGNFVILTGYFYPPKNEFYTDETPDLREFESELEILEGYIRRKLPLPIIKNRHWFYDLIQSVYKITIAILFLLALAHAIKLRETDIKNIRLHPTAVRDISNLDLVKVDYNIVHKNVAVFLIPIFDYSEAAVEYLARDLSNNLGIKVQATTSIRRQNRDFNEVKYKMPAEAYKTKMRTIPVDSDDPNCIYIAITNDYIYSVHSDDETLYTVALNDKSAVIGTYPLAFALPESTVETQDLIASRTFKLVKRTIGQLYYKLPPSDNPKSLLRRELKKIKDIDEMDFEF